MLQFLQNCSRRNLSFITPSKLNRIIQYQFCATAQQQKNPEISAENDDNNSSSINPLLESISETDLFETIKQPESSPKRHSSIEFEQWERQTRPLSTVKESHPFSSILNARSVHEIQQQLHKYKNNFKDIKKQRTLNLVENITSTTNNDSDLNNNYINHNFLSEAICKGIDMCGKLKQYDAGFEIFEQAKQERLGLTPNVFAAAIALTLDQNFTAEALNKAYEIRWEMEDTYAMKPSARIYQVLINNALDLRQFRSANGVVKSIFKLNENEKEKLFKDPNAGKYLRIAIIKFYANTKRIDKALKFMNYLVEKFGNKFIDNYIYSCMLSGIAKMVSDGQTDLIEAGEKLFKQSFEILNKAPTETVFLSFMNMYAYVPDYYSARDLLKMMLWKESWPVPTCKTYSCCLKALNEYGKVYTFSYEEGWIEVDKIIGLMKEYGVMPHCAVYSLLFNFCSGHFCGQPDLERLYEYYDEMMDGNVTLSPAGAQNLMLAGVDWYIYKMKEYEGDKEELKKECMKFVDWAMLQYKKHNLQMIKFHQNNLQYKLNLLNDSM